MSFSNLYIGSYDEFPKRFPRYMDNKVVLVELCQQILEVNTLCLNVKNIFRIPFPIVVGPYSFSSRLDAQNLVKSFENNIKLLYYEIHRPLYDLVNFVRDNLKLGYAYKDVLDIEDF